jgi:hypothetical protein
MPYIRRIRQILGCAAVKSANATTKVAKEADFSRATEIDDA